MKRLKTWEMIEELSKNPDKKFKNQRGEEIRLLPDNDLYFGGENGYNFISITNEWEEVKEPVGFMEAVESGERVKVTHDYIADGFFEEFYGLKLLMFSLAQYLTSDGLADVILNGNWYIED